MKPTRPIQAELRINPKPVRSIDPGQARLQAGLRIRPSGEKVDPKTAVENARTARRERQVP